MTERAQAAVNSAVEQFYKARIVGFRNVKFIESVEDQKCIITEAGKVIMKESIVLKLEAPINILGDTNANLDAVLQLFEHGGYPPQAKYLFLGNYTDSKGTLDLLLLLLALKVKYPDNIFLLRGDRETLCLAVDMQLRNRCPTREMYNYLVWIFDRLPVAAIVSEKIFCTHSGINPNFDFLEKLEAIKRPIAVPLEGPLVDVLWARPDEDAIGWRRDTNDISYIYGIDTIARFLVYYDFKFICRGNECVHEGFKQEAGGQVVTISSNANYDGRQNLAALMKVDENLDYAMTLLKEVGEYKPPKLNEKNGRK